MVAKLLVHADDRPAAIAAMAAALEGTVVEGVTTNIDLHKKILRWEPFVSGQYTTTTLEQHLASLLAGES